MDCLQVKQEGLATKYLQGQLDEEQKNELETHLLECTRCAHAVEALQSTREILVAQAQEIRKQSGGLSPEPVPVKVPGKNRGMVYALVLMCALAVISYATYRRFAHDVAVQQSPAPAATPAASSVQPNNPGQPPPEAEVNGPAKQVNEFLEVQFPATSTLPPTVKPPSPVSGPEQRASAAPPDGASSTPAAQNAAATPPTSAQEDDEKELLVLGTVSPPRYTAEGQATTTEVQPAGGAGKSKSSQTGFQNAMVVYGEERYRDAADLLREVVRLDPKASQANFFLGVCLLTLGHPEDSITPLRAALQDQEPTHAQAAHFYLAKAYVQTRDLESAEGQLSVAASLSGKWKSEAASELPRVRALRLKRTTP